MDTNQHDELLLQLVAGQAEQKALTQGVATRLDNLAPWMNDLNKKVDAKADASDLVKLDEKVDGIDAKQNWTMGVGSAVAGVLTLLATYFGIRGFGK